MPRTPWTISFTRRGDTPTSVASLYWVTLSASRNSFSSISPGWIGFSFAMRSSVVVHDLHVFRAAVTPHEAHAPLVVDADAVLPVAVAMQPLEPVLWSRRVL